MRRISWIPGIEIAGNEDIGTIRSISRDGSDVDGELSRKRGYNKKIEYK